MWKELNIAPTPHTNHVWNVHNSRVDDPSIQDRNPALTATEAFFNLAVFDWNHRVENRIPVDNSAFYGKVGKNRRKKNTKGDKDKSPPNHNAGKGAINTRLHQVIQEQIKSGEKTMNYSE